MSDDRKIIRFPGSASPRKHGDPVVAPSRTVAAQAGRALVGDKPQPDAADGSWRLAVGPLAFSCTGCGAACQADFRRMIFRSVEFHCADCGTFFKVSNPGFAVPRKPPHGSFAEPPKRRR